MLNACSIPKDEAASTHLVVHLAEQSSCLCPPFGPDHPSQPCTLVPCQVFVCLLDCLLACLSACLPAPPPSHPCSTLITREGKLVTILGRHPLPPSTFSLGPLGNLLMGGHPVDSGAAFNVAGQLIGSDTRTVLHML